VTPWRGVSLSGGGPSLLLRERERESFEERQTFRAAYVHPLRGALSVSAAFEEYRFAVDRSALAEKLGGSLTNMQGGDSRIRALSLTAELSGVEVANTKPYVFGGPALVAYRDEPFRFTHAPPANLPPVEHVRPGSSLVRPGGSVGAGVRVRVIGGLHGLAEGNFLAGFHPDGALLAAVRAGVAYAY
jgi:hypothetical protein